MAYRDDMFVSKTKFLSFSSRKLTIENKEMLEKKSNFYS